MAREERIICMVLSRLVAKGMVEELKEGVPAAAICKKLDDRRLIKLTD
jgi:hypothetical protein